MNGRHALTLCLALWVGCAASSPFYLRRGARLGFIKRVAVFPFQNHSEDKFAAERMRDLVITALLARDVFDVVPPEEVDALLREEGLEEASALEASTLRRMGKRLNVQAFVLGAVNRYEEERRGSYAYPVVALSLQLLDADTGTILWRTSGARSGYHTLGRLFGLAAEDVTQVSLRLVDGLLDSLEAALRSRGEAPPPERREGGGNGRR